MLGADEQWFNIQSFRGSLRLLYASYKLLDAKKQTVANKENIINV